MYNLIDAMKLFAFIVAAVILGQLRHDGYLGRAAQLRNYLLGDKMKTMFKAAALALLLLTVGCAQMFTAKTTVHLEVRPDGTCIGDYTSDKEQIGFEASVCGGSVKVDKASTQEAVIAAVLSMQTQILQLVRDQAAKGAGS